MGTNNKQRRAAKQRKRARRQRAGQRAPGGYPSWGEPGWQEFGAYGHVDLLVTSSVRRLTRRKLDDDELHAWAESLERRVRPAPHELLETVLADLVAHLVDAVVGGGWGPADLAQLVARNAGERHLPALAGALHQDARDNRRNATGWLAACDAIGAAPRLRLSTTAEVASALRLAALLSTTPLLEAGAVAGAGMGGARASEEHPKLARVRALLAKAESTEYDEEAEALTAKAQELISRYALGRLLEAGGRGDRAGDGPEVRRIWLDAPYVRPKASLVAEVASANRCRSASADKLGFCVVVGDAVDLDSVELLVTSLLVQADTALIRLGRRRDRYGGSRTRSFRQSFLFAYAARIGERLRAATDDAVSSAGDRDRLLPVLRDHDARVAEAFDAMVPHTVGKETPISDGEGWAAGVAAADLALLDVHGKLEEQAG